MLVAERSDQFRLHRRLGRGGPQQRVGGSSSQSVYADIFTEPTNAQGPTVEKVRATTEVPVDLGKGQASSGGVKVPEGKSWHCLFEVEATHGR